MMAKQPKNPFIWRQVDWTTEHSADLAESPIFSKAVYKARADWSIG